MNDWNQLESHLASWTPRRPSPAIKKKLFAGTPAPVSFFAEAHLWRLLAPGLALFLGLCMLNTRTTPGFTPLISPSTGLVATVALSHSQLASYTSSSAYTEHNVWPIMTFEWTNGNHSLTTAAPIFDTNHLIP